MESARIHSHHVAIGDCSDSVSITVFETSPDTAQLIFRVDGHNRMYASVDYYLTSALLRVLAAELVEAAAVIDARAEVIEVGTPGHPAEVPA